jgi:hypothetical protein
MEIIIEEKDVRPIKLSGKIIICEIRSELYCKHQKLIPYVVYSDLLEFKVGTRFDYGFMNIALNNGYSILLVNNQKLIE